jgi:hypothetical protein
MIVVDMPRDQDSGSFQITRLRPTLLLARTTVNP